jgi:hypothetical protein
MKISDDEPALIPDESGARAPGNFLNVKGKQAAAQCGIRHIDD